MKKLLIFNWKSNPHNAASALKLARMVENIIPTKKNFEVVIAPPFLFLEDIGKVIKKATLGAQDAFWGDVGPYTGEISWHQEKHLKVKYVIVGHSERRKFLNETDEIINKKVMAALKAGLKVILCVGENLSIRKRGKKAVENFIKSQLQKDLNGLSRVNPPAGGQMSNVIVAYEPIWAIGTGHSDTPQDAVEMINFIKQSLKAKSYKLKAKVLYGGSVDGKNIKNFVQYKEIGGFLIGHASLKQKEFGRIIKTINNQ
ncbi:MAG: triose-phosphate isomerase [Patescibacteria group bacterium]